MESEVDTNANMKLETSQLPEENKTKAELQYSSLKLKRLIIIIYSLILLLFSIDEK